MRDPFIAIDVGTNLRSHARKLRRSWEEARGGGGAGGVVRPVIEESWRRTEGAGLDPEHPSPRRAFAPDALDDYRDASGLRECVDALRTCLGGFAHDAEHVMVVVDAECRILWMDGDSRVRRRADSIAFEEGMDWREVSVGTNAIGTALAIDHAVQVFSAEHYSAKQHPWWCSAAPIHDPVSGRVVGVVDLSGPMHTAHPHSLALVTAAAAMAEALLRSQRVLEDERLRRAYLERRIDSRQQAAALVAADGRVLLAESGPWAHGPLDVPRGGGPVALPGGGAAIAEPLQDGGGFVLWDTTHGTSTGTRGTPPTALRLELLGGTRRARNGRDAPVELGLRHAELLCILALNPEGLTTQQLTLQLHGSAGKDVSTRAEINRLRKLLPGVVAARPYRLTTAVGADVLDVTAALRRGDLMAALAAYRAPVLPDSTAPRIVRLRDELEGSLRRAALGGTLAQLWAWLDTACGREDTDALAQFVRRAARGDARRDIAAARLRSLQRSGQLT